jgi:hypothetical protein
VLELLRYVQQKKGILGLAMDMETSPGYHALPHM